ncbi:hypothetical protein [Tahibacter harae]|uniref:Uncharacterized protein n=1 Tax=Tahibacter harae TaxID=2963937 RepID=A0ABT1QVS5_9GAMM|nr:hypothetical protein [Tahibacter harae]MCQ4166382.1 hypothetical protein [Tahibacter harae]
MKEETSKWGFMARIRLTLLPALVIAASAPAHADWRQLAPQPQQALHPGDYLPGKNGTLWSLDGYGVSLTQPDGASRVVLRSPDRTYFEGNVLPDGGILLRDDCLLERLDGRGQRSWSLTDLPRYTCADVAVHSDGSFWLSHEQQLLAYDAHGQRRATIESDNTTLDFDALVTLANGDVVAARKANWTAQTETAAISRYARSGAAAWSWTSTEAWQINHVTLSSDGDILAEMQKPQINRPGAAWVQPALQRWSPSGQLLWSLPLPAPDGVILGIVPAANGESYVLASNSFGADDATLHRVLRVTREGSVRWQEAVRCQWFSPSQIAAEGNDGFALLCNLGQNRVELRRWNASGQSGSAVELGALKSARSLYRLDADSLLANGFSNSNLTLRIGRDDTVAPYPPGGYPLQPAPTQLTGQYLAADGSSYVATQEHRYEPESYDLTRYAADGRRLWSITRPRAYDGFDQLSIRAAGNKVCIAEPGPLSDNTIPSQLACFNHRDGSLAWSVTLPPRGLVCAFRTLGDGRVVSVVGTPSTQTSMRASVQSYSADGRLITDTDAGDIECRSTIDATGRATVVSSTSIAQYEPDGRRNYRVPRESGIELRTYLLTSSDDGSAWLVDGPYGEPRTIRALRPDGSTRWLMPSGLAPGPLYGDYAISATSDAVYLFQTTDLGRGILQSRLLSLDAASGTQRWKHDFTNLTPQVSNAAQFAVSPDGSRVVLARAGFDRLHLKRLDAQSGLLEQQRFIAANTYRRGVRALALDARGTARLTMNLLDDSAGRTAALLSIDHVGTPAPPIRLDQPGIGGAWWSPYANGEGIVLDWIAPQRTLFGAWFTYTSAGGNDPAQLRWYTIQAGNVAANATSVQLPILETTGGNFDAGPPASPIQVGTAQLHFTDCDNGTLDYRFDAGHNDGASGTITLSRLTPATGSCILADGSTRPGAGAKPPQGGFDARMSGTWFEEATSGQGLQFTVQPGGVFFAPWFTYDPQGQGNDANREHWFTLQGSLAGAANGEAEVLIAQSLGGVFDRVPTYNGFAVGKASIRMTACDKARVDYRFDDSERAGSFRKRSGTLELTKIGGCAAAVP